MSAEIAPRVRFTARVSSGFLVIVFLGVGLRPMKNHTSKSAPKARPPQQEAHAPHHGDAHREGGHEHPVHHSAEEWAERLDTKERDAWQKPAQLVGMLHIAPGQTVADVGAGTGYFLKYLSRAVGAGGRVLARDVEDDLVQYMRRRAEEEGLTNVAVGRCALDDPALPRGGVDRILIVNTWHHLSSRVAYGRKLAEALAAGGALYVVDFDKTSSVGPPPEAKLEQRQVVEELDRAGFETGLVKEDLPEQYVIRASLP
jgi:ubiquinone/menaquinone biosynthesis C-methylase UbiE